MNNIQEYFNYLYSLERTGMKYDLENITSLLKHLANPHNNYQSIHLAGTNGKGATASFTASILMEHGLRTGLFTSPHIIRFNERIRVNGKSIPDKFIIDFLNKNDKIIREIKPSFFEVNTAMAFEYFAVKKVDIAVVECGLGGRLDSTNILHPGLSIITQIGIDHMQYLGNTLNKIALEKIGIVKPGIDVIVSDNNKSLKKLFKQKVDEGYLYYLDNILKIKPVKESDFKTYFSIGKQHNYSVPLLGNFQMRNAAAAIYACEKFLVDNGIKLIKTKIQKGLSNIAMNSGYRCRLERFRVNDNEFIIDVSHNADGLRQTRAALTEHKPDIVIFGIMEDKTVNEAVKEVLKISKNIVLTKADYKRASEPDILLNKFLKAGAQRSNLHISKSVKDAVKMAVEGNRKARILVTGSFFIAGEAAKALKLQKYFK